MDGREPLTADFEAHRGRLRAVAYRMLGSLTEADDAVQETWLRLDRSDTRDVANLGGWLTTVVGRVCLDMLRARTSRGEVPLSRLPDPVISRGEHVDPEHEALLADSVGLALLVVLDTLEPAERLAFVLHDAFGVPFREIAALVSRTPAATRQLASRARRRVRQADVEPDADPSTQRLVVEAFLAAARRGDFDALVALLDPGVLVRADTGRPPVRVIRGASSVAGNALTFSRAAVGARLALVNGSTGIIARADGRPFSVMGFTVRLGRIVQIDILTDAARLRRLDPAPDGTSRG
ncbi:MAG TPA: sigma-70 family RNA polymerase sigma factor [Blastococcus sp.]|nr:sigma-70 family RNA polymerase sigma factor [Blastococcus sp.]